MVCLGEIDCGASQARVELLFLVSLLVESGDDIDPRTYIPGTLGFTDVYRCPAMGADDFIQLSKPSVSFIEGLATLRIRALKRVADLIKPPGAHDALPVGVYGSALVPGTPQLPSVLRLTKSRPSGPTVAACAPGSKQTDCGLQPRRFFGNAVLWLGIREGCPGAYPLDQPLWVGRWNGSPVYRQKPPPPAACCRLFFRLIPGRLLFPLGRFVCVRTQ